jgi:NAD+ diphosphatase
LEKGESPEEGILREIEEELGVKAEPVSLVGAYGFARMNQVIIAYHVRIPEDAELTLSEELADSKLVPTAKLVPWSFGTGDAVRDWLAAYRDR